MQSVYECMERTCEKLCQLNIDISNIKGGTLLVCTLVPRIGCWPCLTVGGDVWTTPKPVAGWENKHWLSTIPNREVFIDIYVVAVFSAVGVTNQRETTLVWDKETGEPLYNAIGGCTIHLNEQVSLPSTYLHIIYILCNIWYLNYTVKTLQTHSETKYFTWIKDINRGS